MRNEIIIKRAIICSRQYILGAVFFYFKHPVSKCSTGAPAWPQKHQKCVLHAPDALGREHLTDLHHAAGIRKIERCVFNFSITTFSSFMQDKVWSRPSTRVSPVFTLINLLLRKKSTICEDTSEMTEVLLFSSSTSGRCPDNAQQEVQISVGYGADLTLG